MPLQQIHNLNQTKNNHAKNTFNNLEIQYSHI